MNVRPYWSWLATVVVLVLPLLSCDDSNGSSRDDASTKAGAGAPADGRTSQESDAPGSGGVRGSGDGAAAAADTGGNKSPPDASNAVIADAASVEPAVDARGAIDAPATAPDSGAVDIGGGPPPVDAAPANPVCSTADQNGFFASCSACPSAGDCDTISVNGRSRAACGCNSGCPCGSGATREGLSQRKDRNNHEASHRHP